MRRINWNGFSTILEFVIILPGSVHKSKLFQCLHCKRFFISKNGASYHCCNINNINHSIITPGHPDSHAFALQHLLRFLAVNNISLNAAQCYFLEQSYKVFDPTFSIPKRDKLRDLMISLANDIKINIRQNLANQVVSLMIDGSKRWGKNYIAIVIFTVQRLYLYSLSYIPDEQGATIAQLIADVVNELKALNTEVIAINTDNAANNKKALNGDVNSAQALSDSHFIRQPCAGHTLNLAIGDTFHRADSYFHFVIDDVRTLIHHAPKGTYREGYRLELLNIRWVSLFKCVDFIYNHLDKYKANPNPEVQYILQKIQHEINWDILHKVLLIFNNFLMHLEYNLSTIVDIIPAFLAAYKDLSQLPGNLPLLALNNLQNRFMTTCPLHLPWAAFLLTRDGLEFFRNPDNNFNRQYLVNSIIVALSNYMAERKIEQKLIEMNLHYFQDYLQNFSIEAFTTFTSAYNMWKQLADIPPSFRSLAKEILSIPSTETACERLFSALSAVTQSQMCNISPEMVNARLMVKFDSIFERAGKVDLKKLSTDTDDSLKLTKLPTI